ncbi:fimbrial biogenesis chaperone, partial [Escherichia coli]|uniref:fimbrial biogenesis chaperone n=1 Tax=Escherichia coli TaxID=562 RepID=UPI00207B7007
GNNARNGGKNSLNRLIRCVCGKKIGPDPRNFNQRVSLGRNDLLIRTFPSVRAVPSTTKREEGNTLKIATQSVIKLFWRPKGLAYPLAEAPAKLRCTSSADMVTVSNPTPYFITLTDLKIGGKVVKNQMISPFDKYQFSLPKGAKNSSVTYRTINDYGAETPQLNCKS